MSFSDDLKNFLEDRLISFDPSIDISDNSPAQLQIISPTIARFGEDPFATDIPTFIRDRLVQEFPELGADNGGALEDILTKPLQLLLEPFKREIEAVRINSSVNNATLMSESEADALGANWFINRNEGDFSSGLVRLYFSSPTTVRVSTDKLLSTSDGRGYFPIQNYFITASQMLFNKQGSFYFLDIVVRAESEGDQFNVGIGDINSVEQVPGVVKVSNLVAFVNGSPKETNNEYFDRIQQSLTDRSLVTKRGATTRVDGLFPNVRALQIIGAGDPGMDRDILTGTGQGFLHIAGKAVVYGNWMLVSELTYRDDGIGNAITPQPGDTIRFHATTPAPAVTDVVTAEVVSILSTSGGLFLFLLDSSPYTATVIQSGAFALFKPGQITISGVPGGISSNTTVADDSIHLGGHTDVFVRPAADVEINSVLQNISDSAPVLAITDLTVSSSPTNAITSAASNFISSNVQVGNILVIDNGAGFAGSYKILEIPNANTLRLDSIFPTDTTSPLRAKILSALTIDAVNPKTIKLPYTSAPLSDLQTNVGSNEFLFSSTNIQDYGAKVGDTINVLDGADAGEFTIIGFGLIAGSVLVHKVATSTGSHIGYEVYTKQVGLSLPLIRIKNIEVLDSTGQTTGITVPYGDAVDIRPESTFETAGHSKTTYDKQLLVFPDMPEWLSGGLTPDPEPLLSINDTTDARYSLGTAIADGVVRRVTNHSSNQVQTTEINVPAFLWNGKRDKLIALVSRTDPNYPTSIPGVHESSDIADSKIGDSLTINDGPNKGKYIIIDLRILELWGKADQGHRKVALIQVDPPLKVDPIRTAINLINDHNGTPLYTASQLYGFLQYAADWDNTSGFFTTFLNDLNSTLSALGISLSLSALKDLFNPILRSGYTVGPSATGNFKLYFLDPVTAEFFSGDDPTTFSLASDGSKSFRISPDLPPAQILPESIQGTSPALWNRNLGTRSPADSYAYLTSGSPFILMGIKANDILQIYPAINDLPSRDKMSSSWMCVTETGSNTIQLILPQSDSVSEIGYGGVDNYTAIAPGQLLFIDSGPDIGAYTIINVLTQNWSSNPPVLKVQVDRPMTHTTEDFPLLSTAVTPPSQLDFNSSLPAYVQGSSITFPVNLNGKHLKVDVSTDGGTSFTTVQHVFSAADPYADIASILADIDADVTFTASVTASNNGNSLVLISPTSGPRTRVRISTTPTAPSAHITLGLVDGTTGLGVRGGATLPGTKRLYGSDLSQCNPGDYITLYAAKNTSILSNGDDVAVIGTYKIITVGSDTTVAPFWSPVGSFVEVDRTSNFPAGAYIEVRWLRHDAPATSLSDTSEGGKEISDQFVRFRMYASEYKQLSVLGVPWSASLNPLLEESQQQLQLQAPGIISASERNFSHKSPFRILRKDVYKISSTDMSSSKEGALYLITLPVVGYGPGPEMNVTPDDGFILSGNRIVNGYTLDVKKEIFTYSTQEQLDLILPNAILPIGSSSDITNLFNLVGQNIQITYNNAPLVEDLQLFFDSPQDRVTAANMLVRHFLPAYVLLDALYSGGDTEANVAAALVEYINNIPADTAEIRTDLLKDIITKRGAITVDLPLTVIALVHGIDRKIRGMRSTKSIGIGDTPFFKGNFKQTYFIAGPNTSGQNPRPSGEQIFLIRT